MRVLQKVLIGGVVLVAGVCYWAGSALADFNANNLIDNGPFVDVNKMDTGAIQRFLERQNSYLKDFSEGGRTAAQIIYGAAHGNGDATGSINGIDLNGSTGTINPEAILVTLQKEQSLISKATRDDNALSKAMGYGCPDSGSCNPSYASFTKQVENGSWQLRYNYERAEGRGFSDYQVGQDFCFDDWNGTHCGRFDNRATSALYRYTPHVYNGNYNFWNLYFNTYQFQVREYGHSFITQNGYPTLASGQFHNFNLYVQNTGTATWTRGQVNLGTARERDRVSPFTREGNGPSGWVSPNRVQFQEASVAPGGTATFSFWLRNDGVAAGTYREYYQLVADNGGGWMEDYGIYWEVRVPTELEKYQYSHVGQSGYATLSSGQAANLWVKVQNTGSATWTRGQVNLGTSHDRDRVSPFTREGGNPSGWVSPNRVQFEESSVAPGQTATFSFWVRNDGVGAGTYREYFQPVADGVGWMADTGIYWEVKTLSNQDRYQYSHQSQSGYATLSSGQAANLWVKVQNTGSVTWTRGQVNLGTSHDRDRVSPFTREGGNPSGWVSPNRVQFEESSVAPGQTATFSFWVRNDGVGAGTYREYFQPVADGVGWMADTGIYWEVTVP